MGSFISIIEIVKCIEDLTNAVDSLMDEVTGTKAADWLIINDAMVRAQKLLKHINDGLKDIKKLH